MLFHRFLKVRSKVLRVVKSQTTFALNWKHIASSYCSSTIQALSFRNQQKLVVFISLIQLKKQDKRRNASKTSEIFHCGTQARPKNMFQLKIKSYFVKLCNKTCGTTRFRIEGFDLNLHIDAEFALRDTGCSDSIKKSL